MNPETTANTLATIEINPPTPATKVLIWMHGLGATNDDFVPVAGDLQRFTGLALRFVFPQAPDRPVTINNGYIMPAWYDITSFDREGNIDHEGIGISIRQIKDLIQAELRRGFSSRQIILAGFSQGAVIALSTMLAYPEPLGGVIALSGYLPYAQLPSGKPSTPIFMAHGIEDNVVPYLFGEAAYETLKKAQFPVSWHTYPMPHSVCMEELRDLGEWLKS